MTGPVIRGRAVPTLPMLGDGGKRSAIGNGNWLPPATRSWFYSPMRQGRGIYQFRAGFA
jgi:hypothetical protein